MFCHLIQTLMFSFIGILCDGPSSKTFHRSCGYIVWGVVLLAGETPVSTRWMFLEYFQLQMRLPPYSTVGWCAVTFILPHKFWGKRKTFGLIEPRQMTFLRTLFQKQLSFFSSFHNGHSRVIMGVWVESTDWPIHWETFSIWDTFYIVTFLETSSQLTLVQGLHDAIYSSVFSNKPLRSSQNSWNYAEITLHTVLLPASLLKLFSCGVSK